MQHDRGNARYPPGANSFSAWDRVLCMFVLELRNDMEVS